MTLHALGFGEQHRECVEQPAFLRVRIERVIVERAHEVASTSARADHRGVRPERDFAEALVEHAAVEALEHAAAKVADVFHTGRRLFPEHAHG